MLGAPAPSPSPCRVDPRTTGVHRSSRGPARRGPPTRNAPYADPAVIARHGRHGRLRHARRHPRPGPGTYRQAAAGRAGADRGGPVDVGTADQVQAELDLALAARYQAAGVTPQQLARLHGSGSPGPSPRRSPRPDGHHGRWCQAGQVIGSGTARPRSNATLNDADERSVKPSAQPTLVRTQHLPLPAETAPGLRKRVAGAVSFLSRRVSVYVTVSRRVAVSTDV